ncbi:hypothetical protein SERLA73DRAFT_185281 [Serpula lacrymans var. lacrymans S7.3]|uniref:Thioesterase domain-containing protein n=2 Tax=Serpula lacrymans var. lacrymans TaxID=341189 RepID=F8Q4F2_SERL3|nr:uncharacterized protein SERLADRAFT_473639 [Serpula lacrymans var. lacrymans S7.9]EGN97007.1 hypothetical protein SERLA73DRAFT_185281 [Serpula lacrymans var. lacrymans S7.3]EGO22598.1 hypothetical protein SERLADRAFT_473639 [Serpula lacrymans var. lacrymans S7.9]
MHLLTAKRALRLVGFIRSYSSRSSIESLQAAFRDPSSPFHIPPGTQGPASPDPLFEANPILDSVPELAPREEATQKLLALGYDPSSLWEQSIVWGHHDAFQHVNNAQYVRFFESGRMEWIMSIGNDLGGPTKVQAMLKAQGISFILKSISVNFRRPVTYPDTLLIAHKPHLLDSETLATSKPKRGPPLSHTQFNLHGIAYSYSQRAIVADSDAVIVWYDYDKLKRCDPGEVARNVIWNRMKHASIDGKQVS